MKLLKMLAVTSLVITTQVSMAQTFNNGIPAGWTALGNAGTSGANGVVPLSSLSNSTAYGWVSTTNSTAYGIGANMGHETNGASLTSTGFSVAAGAQLKFDFNYVTSDGGSYSDYSFANLLYASDNAIAAVLFDARTGALPDVSGFGLPAPVATLYSTSNILIAGAPDWSPLGSSSQTCFPEGGCGYTGWIASTYSIPTAGTYKLQFGVTNWIDDAFDSGLAFDGMVVDAVLSVPEPDTGILLFAGLLALSFVARRNKAW